MSFSLGQAKLILDVDAQPLIEAEAVAWKATRQGAQAVSAFLAKENNVRVNDVKKAASIIIDEEKKLAREQLAEAKKLAAERKKAVIDGIKNEVAELKSAENQRKAQARAILEDEKKIEQARLAEVRRTLREEATLRRQAAAERKRQADEERKQQAANTGVFGTGISGAKIGATTATLLGFGAIASGALVAREAITSLIDATLKQDEAQRALNASFGKSSELYKGLADQYAKQFSLIGDEVQKSVAQLGTLDRQSNISSEQLKKLIPIAIDLQAAYGGDLREAFRSVQGAILGETEALEKYGIVLQDGVLKTLPQLTTEEKKRFETMSESEKQLIRYRVLLSLASESQGAAAQRAKEAQGGFNDFTNASNELALALGKNLVPALGNVSRAFADNIVKFTDWINKKTEYDKAQAELASEQQLGFASNVFLSPADRALIRRRVEQNAEVTERRRQISEEQALNLQRQKDAQKAENDRVDRENAAVKKRAEIAVAELKDAARRELDAIEAQKKRYEAQERIALTSLENRYKATIASLEATEIARREASESELERINLEKDRAIQAAEEARDASLQNLREIMDAYEKASEEKIRLAEITRDRLIKAIEVQAENEIRELDNLERERREARIFEDREIEKQLEKEQRAREDAHKQQLRRFEREGEKLREDSSKRTRKIDEEADAEDDRHAKKIRNLEDESRAQEDYNRSAIELIEKQIGLLDAQEKAENQRRRLRDLGSRATQAQANLANAQGVGSAEEIAIARNQLTAAIKLGDPEAVKKAQKDLIDLAGQGAEAIAKAQQELAEIQQDLIDENVDQAREAEKDKLLAAKQALDEEAKAHKATVDKELIAERRAEDDRNKRRKDRLDKDKLAEKDRLDDALKKLEKRQEADADTYERDKRGAEDAKEFAKEQLEDRRRLEDQTHKDSLTRIKNREQAEKDAVKATYDDEVTGIIPAIKRAEKAAKEQYERNVEQAQARYKAERKEIYDTYDDPVNGLIARHKDAEQQAVQSYEAAKTAARLSFEAQRDQIKQTYRNDDGVSGLLDRLEAQKKKTEDALRDDLAEWEKWKDGIAGPNGVVTRTFADAKAEFDKFLNDLKARGSVTVAPRIVVNTVNTRPAPSMIPGPDPGMPGGTNPGIQNGPDPGLPPGGGMGTVPQVPGTTTPTGTPDPEQSSGIPPDEISNMFSVSFGYGAKYSGRYQSGPGWAQGAAWPGGPSHHKGIDLILPGPKNGYGKPIPAFSPGRVLRTVADSRGPGGNMVIIEDNAGRTHWYLHLKDYAVSAGQQVKRGDIIAHLGDTGTEEFPHLHYEVRNGDNNGPMSYEALLRDGIDPNSYIKGRNAGYLFRNPTVYKDTVTGEVGVLAEKAPERLLGSAETRRYDTGSLSPGGGMVADYASIGGRLSGMSVMDNGSNGGDTLVYNGVAPADIFKSWNSHKSKRRILRGVSK